MSFGNILGKMLEQGLSGQTRTRERIDTLARNLGAEGAPVERVLGSLQSALGGEGAPGGFAETARTFLRERQAGGLTGGQITGIGAVAGALLGGGLGGAARGTAMAVLGTLALTALRRGGDGGEDAAPPPRAEIAALTSEASERLALRAMIAAAKADGHIDDREMDRILAHLTSDEATAAERRFVLEEIRKPLDVEELARAADGPAQAAEIYAASLLAIDADSEPERAYLRELARALRLDPATVAFLHRTTGTPEV